MRKKCGRIDDGSNLMWHHEMYAKRKLDFLCSVIRKQDENNGIVGPNFFVLN